MINRTYHFSSNNEDDIDNSIHSHTAPPFLMSPAESKLFSTPGSFNFSMAALAADSAALAGTHSPNIDRNAVWHRGIYRIIGLLNAYLTF